MFIAALRIEENEAAVWEIKTVDHKFEAGQCRIKVDGECVNYCGDVRSP